MSRGLGLIDDFTFLAVHDTANQFIRDCICPRGDLFDREFVAPERCHIAHPVGCFLPQTLIALVLGS